MESQFVEFTLVVIANDHNPTLLNPDFLQRNKIVKDEWDWQVVGQPITTPAVSTVAYGSKVVVTLDPMKLQITDKSGVGIDQTHLCEFISNYVATLPHVQYSALGINFTMISATDDVTGYLIERFIKEGTWNQESNQMRNVGLNFSYDLDNGNITFSIDKGAKKDEGKPIIVSRANFHRDLDMNNMPTSEQIKSNLNNIMKDWDRFQQLHSAIFKS